MTVIERKWITVDTDGRALQAFNIEENARIEAVTDTRVMGVIEVVPADRLAGAVSALRHILESAEHPSLTVRSTEYIAKVAGDALAALALPRTDQTKEDR